MFPTKTDKARDELQGRQRTLSQRERALLLMADGRRSLTDFSPLFASRTEAEQAIQALMRQGYLQDAQPVAAAGARVQVATGAGWVGVGHEANAPVRQTFHEDVTACNDAAALDLRKLWPPCFLPRPTRHATNSRPANAR